jgi:hypothetical protein
VPPVQPSDSALSPASFGTDGLKVWSEKQPLVTEFEIRSDWPPNDDGMAGSVVGATLIRKRNGRTNSYAVRPDAPIDDPLLGDHWVGELLAVLAGSTRWPTSGDAAPAGDEND